MCQFWQTTEWGQQSRLPMRFPQALPVALLEITGKTSRYASP